MNSKLSCNRLRQPRASKRQLLLAALGAVLYLLAFVHTAAAAASAPDWMRALVNAPLPAHDEKTDAVLLYSEESVTVISADKVKTQVREAYKILRPEGRQYGTVSVPFDARTKVTRLRGWCIPAQGSAYEVKEKDAVELSAAPDFVLMSDVKEKRLEIPAAEPGNIVGYEYEVKEQPFVLQESYSTNSGAQ